MIFSAGRTGAETGPETVAELVGDQLGLTVNDLQRSLGAIRNALSAAVTQFLVDLNDFPHLFHDTSPWVMAVRTGSLFFACLDFERKSKVTKALRHALVRMYHNAVIIL